MKTHRLTEEYTQAFRVFLDHTSEKHDLLAVLKRRIKAVGGGSLLDIGAGNGDLAVPLSRLVDTYIALEPNPDHAAKLRLQNIAVFQVSFPWKIVNALTFDVVLASHVVPWEETESSAFLCAARSCLNPRGTFMMITYDEERSPWGELLQKSGLPLATVGQGHLEGYKKLLAGWGTLEIETITTHVKTERLDEMLLALSFVYSDGVPDRAEKFRKNPAVKEVLDTRYRSAGRYRFPFTHYLLQVGKAK